MNLILFSFLFTICVTKLNTNIANKPMITPKIIAAKTSLGK